MIWYYLQVSNKGNRFQSLEGIYVLTKNLAFGSVVTLNQNNTLKKKKLIQQTNTTTNPTSMVINHQ